jgi:predicted RNA-binding Zn-ribbon protein involved in translation (DUF1610 family)
MNPDSQVIERDADGIPQCENCGASHWTIDGSGLAAGLYSCGNCGYLPKAWRRDRIKTVLEDRGEQ